MANPTTNFGWVMPTSSSLVTNLPADFNTFGQAVDTSMSELLGGTTGQVLSKTSNTNMDFTWVTPTDQTPLTTKGDIFAFSTVDARLPAGTNETRLVADSTQTLGLKYVADTTNYAINAKADLLVGTAADTLAALSVGTNGQVLTADSTVSPTGLKWATPAGGGGKVLQVVSATNSTEKSIASTSFTDTNLTITITPTSATSKVLILISQNVYLSSGTAMYTSAGYQLLRDSTSVINYSGSYDQAIGIYAETLSGTPNATLVTYLPVTYLDSPATTSAVTYKTQLKMSSTASGRATLCQQAGSTSSIIALEIGA